MKQSPRWLSISFNMLLFTGLVVIWIAFAPAKIGGRASYVMVNGISMEPNYHTGDLVIVHKADTYQVGDVVTYRDAQMGAFVIHRIIGIEQGQFVLKGDNNSWIDAYHPAHDEIIGKQWVHAPRLGNAMLWLRRPINMSLAAVLLGGVLMTSMITKPSKGQKGKKRPPVKLGGIFEGSLYLLGILFLGFLGLTIFAFTRPTTRTAANIPYQQDSNYVYSATGTPGVYDTEMVRSGEPVFPKLACFLNVGFTYNILGGELQGISGYHQMFARIMDEQSGWQRTIPMISQTAFAGNSYFATAALDLCQMEALVNLVEKETGFHTNTYTVEIVTNIAFTANTAGQAVSDTFDPVLAFKYDKVHLYLPNTNDEIDPLHTTKEGLVGSSNVEANTLSLMGWEPTIGFIRVFALLGLGVSLVGLIVMGLFVYNTAGQSEDGLIRLRYGSMLMDVYERSLNISLPIIDATSIDDLAKMAERQNTMILHVTHNFQHYYLVQGNDVIYRYVLGGGESRVPENVQIRRVFKSDRNRILGSVSTQPALVDEKTRIPESLPPQYTPNAEENRIPETVPAGEEVIEYISESEEYIFDDPQPQPQEVSGYVIHIGSITVEKTYEETEMLRKIRI